MEYLSKVLIHCTKLWVSIIIYYKIIELENHYCEGDHHVHHGGSLDGPDPRHVVPDVEELQEKQIKIRKIAEYTGRKNCVFTEY